MGATEIVQAMISPAEKLIEAVSGAIGKAYEPRHVRKMADAKAYELKLIADTVRNNSDVPIVYDSTGVSIDTSNYEEIAKRASYRLAFQEITKQQNIEAVVDRAYDELSGEESANSEPVSQDWMSRFFNSVEDISNEKMQEIWGHILAGEIRSPNTYTYRTLECLKNITQQSLIFNSKYIGLIREEKPDAKEIELSIFVFTGSGIQLMNAIQPKCSEQYLFDCLQFIADKHKDFSITAHKINNISDDGRINYNTDISFITEQK